MSTLVVATDFSTRSDRALRRAILLARDGTDELLLAHVVDDDQPPRMIDAARREAQALIAEIAASVREADGLSCDWSVQVGEPCEQIIALAREAGAEMLVMGRHRRRLLRDLFIGTTAERAIRRSELPILVANAVPTGDYGLVMLPTDFEAASRHAAVFVADLPFLRRADFLFLHLYDAIGSQMLARSMASGTDMDEQVEEEAGEARAAMDRFVRSLGLARTSRQAVRPLSGLGAKDVSDAAAEHRVDLIALARSNKGMVERAILGSMTEGLLREGDRDILVVPA